LFIEYENLPMRLANKFVQYFTQIFMKLPTYICNLDTDFKLKNKNVHKYL